MKFVEGEERIEAELSHGDLTVSGEDEKGFRPYQLLVASVASCSGSVFKRVLEKKRIEFDNITIEASVKRDEKKANRIEEIQLTFKVTGEALNLEQLEKSLVVSSKNCAMVRSVENSINIQEIVEIV